MRNSIDAVRLPVELEQQRFDRQHIFVVIDVLRATSTMVAAVRAGATGVVPVASIEAARLFCSLTPDAVLAGERDGTRIDGFDLGNSPLEMTAETVGGRCVVMTTTNGTGAINAAQELGTVVTASMVNLEDVADVLSRHSGPVTLVCSGTDGRRSLEDELCAGVLLERFSRFDRTDRAMGMRQDARELITRVGGIEEAIRSSSHAQRLDQLGFGHDVEWCARVGRAGLVLELDPDRGVLERR